MILGIGIDIVEVDRFDKWLHYTESQLSSIFTTSEIIEFLALEKNLYAKQYLASRFAAKEAFYKAFSNTLIKLELTEKPISFQKIRPLVEVKKPFWDVPVLEVDWQEIEKIIEAKTPNFQIDLSLAHETHFAVANVIIQKT